MFRLYILFPILVIFISNCRMPSHPEGEKKAYQNHSDEAFNNYWYSGEAELNSYDLEQSRYGEIRQGEAILVFVTEDFLTNKQVKKEKKSNAPYTSALKLNFMRKFTTGIYDYSMMTSVFSAVNQERNNLPIKITSSAQEWCGQSFTQLNQTSDHYHLRSFSYFEEEGDVNRLVDLATTEDGIWVQIRIAPNQIPEGEVEMIPGSQYQRFTHDAIKTYDAEISKSEQKDSSGNSITTLKIQYPSLDRTLQIYYQTDFPHQIKGWKEIRSHKGKQLITEAKLKKTIRSPYWEQNHLKDSLQRKKLLLGY